MIGRPVVERWRRLCVVHLAICVLGGLFATAAEASAAEIPQAVTRYAPLVWLHPGDRYKPVSAISFISRSRLLWHRGLLDKDVVDAEITVSEMPKLGAACRLGGRCYAADDAGATWLSADHTRPHDGGRGPLTRYHGFALDHGGPREGKGVSAPAYYIYRRGQYVTYWFFYAYSVQFGVGHEGDWEHITVLLDADDRARRLQHFFHGCDDWSGMTGKDVHPVVFSARGSHATYLRAGPHAGRCKGRDVTARGAKWQTWRSLRNAEAEPWYGFGGAWGSVRKLANRTGPLGPSPYKPNCADRAC